MSGDTVTTEEISFDDSLKVRIAGEIRPISLLRRGETAVVVRGRGPAVRGPSGQPSQIEISSRSSCARVPAARLSRSTLSM